MEIKNRILLIPDAYYGNGSGAIVAQVAKKILTEIGYKVDVFSVDILEHSIEKDDTVLYPRTAYNGLANWREKKYIEEYVKILNNSEAKVVFTIGSITNKNLCYLEIAKQRGLKVISKIFMQDFFCIKLYANNLNGPCTKCLDNTYIEAFKNKCIITKPIDYLKTANGILIRKRLEKILPKIDFVITSSEEQKVFYQKFGIPQEKCLKTPLYFDNNRLKDIKPIMGDYFVCIAQNRVEKGFQYLKEIMSYCDSSISIVAAYNDSEQANIAINKYGFQKFINSGMLKIIPNLKWETGLAELVANSRGVIIPTIWSTTTEFALLEALGYQKPVFCFDVGIHPEIIENGVNGFISKLGDCKTLALQLLQVKSSISTYLKVSKNAGLLYNKMTNWNDWKNNLIEIGL
jgi:glycosyltransferase involved in cell wall biosynthesis